MMPNRFVTETGCTVNVVWFEGGDGRRPGIYLTLHMEQPGDGRIVEVRMTRIEALALSYVLQNVAE